MSLPLSATIITFNEEDNIVRTLEALGFIEDIVIVDSGSKDNTLELIRKNCPNARLFEREFDTYSDQKNFALSKTKEDWVLALDADEVVSPKLKEEIISLFGNDISRSDGYLIPRLTWYLGKWIRFGGFFPNYQLRLFRKDKGKFGGGLVHERVKLPSKPLPLKHPLFHYSYKNISDHLGFIDRYSSLFAEEEHRKGKKSSVTWAVLKGSFKAFYMYFIRMGIFDGKAGFVLAVLGFYYNFLKYLKLYEKNNNLSVSSFFIMVDSVHDIKSNESAEKDSDQIHIGKLS
ncbi:glycosyltransferase family 2 protein [Leptospira ilyithenensis]|uniref:Glycosyltransferase family 2 protein n=1 Tax=Leptospira ilyithenensis TaxID=2484901 RepID=A0A4R9LQL6_9LEPT|nr:glycosyltransferase family 2 protein [Leptospira ilyithenensis]TGN10527.1 glycosyltransferase family 2 protein [Leptospira ilyithenensis]